mgnify:FL=1
MANYHKWTEEEVKVLVQYVEDKVPYNDIADVMGLTPKQIRSKVFLLRKEGLINNYVRTRWTPKMDEYLVKIVANNPGNLVECFKKVAEKYNISEIAVTKRYYNKVKKTKKIFTVFGWNKADWNVKNGKLKQKHNIWKKIKEFFN